MAWYDSFYKDKQLTDLGKGLAAGLGGLLGFAGGSPQSQGSQGYTGGIPELVAQRSLVPNAFDSTGRRPGEAGRRYFTDISYTSPGMNAAGTPRVMGQEYLDKLNADALTAQLQQANINEGLLKGIFGLQAAKPVTPTQPIGPTDKDISTAVKAIKTEYGMTPAGYERMIKAMTNYGVSPDRLAEIIGVPADTVRKYVNDYYGKTGVFAPPAMKQIEEVIIEDDFGRPPKLLEQAPTTDTKAPEGPTDTEIRRLIGQAKSQYGTGAEGIKALVGAMKNVGITPQRMADIMGVPLSQVQRAYDKYYAKGGIASLSRGYYLGGTTDGMADKVPATIDGREPARLSDGEFVIPADVVSHLGNGNSDAGAKNLYSMMDRVRKARTGTTKQGTEINPQEYLA